MRYILVLLLATSIYAQSCYTVQLVSAYNSKKNYDALSAQNYNDLCKLMEIGKTLTVRCGCYEKFKEAEKILPEFQKNYKNAYITTTYKSRFENETPIPLQKQEPVLTKNIETISEKPIQKHVPAAVEDREIISEKIVQKPEPITAKKVEATNNKIVPKSKKEKKRKKKKKNRVKYTKKRTGDYSYSRYLDKLESKKGSKKFDYKYKFGAQLSYDMAYIYEADKTYLTSYWRRIRVYHKGSFFDEKLFYELEYSFTGSNEYKDIFLGYKNSLSPLNLNYRIKYGNIKIPFSLERYTSSKYITFMERALNDAYADGRKLGAELLLCKKLDNDRINLFTSIFSNSIDERMDHEVNQPGYSIRLTYAHKFEKNHLLSVGGAFMSQDMQGEDIRFSQASESELMRDKYVSVRVKDVDSMKKTNIEALYIYNRYSLQAEYIRTSLDALNGEDYIQPYSFKGYYLQGSYFIVGSGRKYKFSNSTIAKIKPKIDGAVELAFRYSHIDLNDKDEQGGTQTDYNYGVNWYINNELKFMVNYVVAEPKGTDEYDGRLQLLQARVLFAF
ncbi:MAG: porin [Campylobacterota bacterium]|nr:porin [Campylobacterota bacterium]